MKLLRIITVPYYRPYKSNAKPEQKETKAEKTILERYANNMPAFINIRQKSCDNIIQRKQAEPILEIQNKKHLSKFAPPKPPDIISLPPPEAGTNPYLGRAMQRFLQTHGQEDKKIVSDKKKREDQKGEQHEPSNYYRHYIFKAKEPISSGDFMVSFR